VSLSSEGSTVTVIDHPSPESQSEPEPAVPGLAVVGRVLLELDPRLLQDNPANPRADLGDLGELTASIAESGVLEPLIVTPNDGEGPAAYVISFGHRRRAAAVGAGLATVPCDVRPEYAGRTPEQIVDMLAENLHRRDLTGMEEAAGYAQLSMFDGWDPARIAGRLGRPVERVRAGLAASKVGQDLRPKVVDGGLTLEQAAAIEEFASDAKAYARLVKAADYPVALHHALASERRRVEVAERKDTVRRELAAAGVRVIGKPKDFPWSSVEIRLSDLTAADGGLVTAEVHASCPGHAAFLETDGEAVFVCRHPKDYGHQTPAGYSHLSVEEVRAAEEAARARREQEEALRVADAARASFLADYLARKGRPAAETLRMALRVLAGREHLAGVRAAAGLLLNPGAGSDAGAAVFVEAVERTNAQRLPYVLLAYAAAAGEANLRARKASWQFDGAYAVLWLTTVEKLGYPLSEVEAQCRAYWSTPLEDEQDLLDGDLPEVADDPGGPGDQLAGPDEQMEADQDEAVQPAEADGEGEAN
jgi:ParB/RepB/Spo0J family partition protein